MASWKGKEKVIEGKGSPGKRKYNGGDDDKSGGRKRNRGVLQFFDDAAYEVDEESSGDDDLDVDDYLEDEFENDVQAKNEPAKVSFVPFIKEEEMDDLELEKMVEERYGRGSSFVTYAEEGYDNKRTMDQDAYPYSSRDPTLWKVKCMVGRERHSVFCLMQKYVELRSLGTKLQIISAFSLDHAKGYIYIEADKQQDLHESCKGLSTVYLSKVAPVPQNEFSHVLSVRSKNSGITEGMWSRVKNGKYKGDLAQVVAVNDARRKVTVKLIPRIDLRALAEKFGGGVTAKKSCTPTPRLISSSELEEFRPLIQVRRDRDTNKTFEMLDGMMLKDGYLYKKVSVDSLSVWGVMPTEDELLKFEPSNNNESNDLEWLSNLYGNGIRKKKQTMKIEKGGGKGEGSSSSNLGNNFEVHDLVFFGKKDFGVIIGTEKDEFKIMKEGTAGPAVLTMGGRNLKRASFDKKLFTAQDQHLKSISINDTVMVLDGPLKDRQGVVKQIYKGVVFFFNETEQEKNGYICVKSQKCEKVITPVGESHEQVNEPGPSGFGDFMSSENSPLSPKKSWQGRDNSNFNREDKNEIFSVGQSLRIRVGPLKGYLCRVLAVRRSDVTVKLDSQHKILTVKCEQLSEVRGRSSGSALGENQESAKPFDLLGTTDGSRDWANGVGTTTQSGGWNTGGLSTEGTCWPSFPPSSNSLQPDSGAAVVSVNTADDDALKDDSAWGKKSTSGQNPVWGAARVDERTAAGTGQIDGWGKLEDSWKKTGSTSVVATGAADNWGKAVESQNGSVGHKGSWGRDGEDVTRKDDSNPNKATWNSYGPEMEKQTGGCGDVGRAETSGWMKPTGRNENQTESWGSKKSGAEGGTQWGHGGSSWGKAVESQQNVTAKDNQGDFCGGKVEHQQSNKEGSGVEASGWKMTSDGAAARAENWNTKRADKDDGGSSWSKKDSGSAGNKNEGGSSWSKPAGGSSWGQQVDAKVEQSHDRADRNQSLGKQGGSSWSKQDDGSSWSRQGGGSSWNKNDGGSSWSKPAGGSSFGQQDDAKAKERHDRADDGSSWSRQGGGSSWNKNDGGSSWSKPAGGSSFDQQAVTSAIERHDRADDQSSGKHGGSSWNKQEGGSSWNKKDGGSAWNKPAGGSSWGKQADGKSVESDDRTDQTQSWGKQGGSSWSKQDGGSSWSKQTGGSSWNKTDGGSTWSKPAVGSSWGQKLDVIAEEIPNRADENQSLGKQGGSSWNKQDGGSSWNRKEGAAQGSSWGQQADAKTEGLHNPTDEDQIQGKQGGSSRSNQDGRSYWSKQGGRSSWNKSNDESSWSKAAGGSSWGQQADKKETHDRADKNQSWGTQGGSSTHKQDGGSSWSKQGGGSSWNKDNGESLWSKPAGGSSWGQQADKKAGETHKADENQSWGKQGGSSWNKQDAQSSLNRKDDGSAWNKPAGGSSWGQQADAKAEGSHDGAGENQSRGKQGGSWSKQDGGSSWSKPAGGSSWGQQADANAKGSNDETVQKQEGGSSWSRPSGGSGWCQKDEEKRDQTDGWNVKRTSGGGSSTGWGQSNWGKSGVVDAAGENQSSAWTSKSNWNSGNDFGGSQEQTDSYSRGRGRGGSWRGGRGQSDRGEFEGRGGSGRGGYGGRGGSEQGGFGFRDGSERGSFGGRERSERGGFGGRGRSDRGGFRGRGRSDRGGFGGRGRGTSDHQYGDWNNRNDSGEEKAQSWSKSSYNGDGGGNNENKGSWNQGGGDNGQWKGWSSGNQSKEDIEGKGGDGGQIRSWSSGGSWTKSSNNAGRNQGSASGGGPIFDTWNIPIDTNGGQAKEVNRAAESEGPADSWGSAAASSSGKASGGW